MKLQASTFLLVLMSPALFCACKPEASGDVFALDANVELRLPKGFIAQPGRASHGTAYVEPDAGDHAITFGLAGKQASNCQVFADCFPEYDETIFRCVASGPPRIIPPERARELGFSIADVTATTLSTEDAHDIRVLFVRTHHRDRDEDALDAYVFTGASVPADIRLFGTAKDVDRYGARVRESIATLHAKTAVVWTSPSADECRLAAARKRAIETNAVASSPEGQPVNVAPGSLFRVDLNLGRECIPELEVEPRSIAVLEGATMPGPLGGPGNGRRVRAMFLASAAGDGAVQWTCRKTPGDVSSQHGSIAVHVGDGTKEPGR